MKSSDILVFTATYNEAGNIGLLIDQIVRYLPSADILVVDDASPDGTWQEILSKLALYPGLRAVQRSRKFGIGSAHKYALIYAIRRGYKTLITMDADFSHEPKSLPALLAAHSQGAFVTGSRYCNGGSSSYTGYRNFLSRMGNLAARLALRVELNELTTYFRVFDVSSLRELPLRYVDAKGYSYGVQLIECLRHSGVELREVPIAFRDRSYGKSKIPKVQILISAVDLLRLALRRLVAPHHRLPDILVNDECVYCGDRALTMTRRSSGIGENAVPFYVCLCCMREQHPRSVIGKREFVAT